MDTQQKLQSYQLLIEMVKKTTSTMESDSILQFILDGIISVLTCVDVGVLFLYEKDKDMLKMVATHNINFDDEYPYLKSGESISGKCFLKRDCIALNSTETFVNYMDCLATHMKSFPDANLEYPYSAMTCCLMVDDQAVGVVIVYNFTDKDYAFTDDDLGLFSAAADHAAITISKSQLIKQKDYYLKQLEESNRVLESTVEIQSHFTDIILNSSGFSNILEYLKTVIKGEVALYDVFFHEIYSTDKNNDIPWQQLIDDNHLIKIIEKQHHDNIYYRKDGQLVVINPIIVQKNLIGFLIIILDELNELNVSKGLNELNGREFSKKDEAVLNHAALVIVLEWSKHDAITKSFSDFSNKFLDLVLGTTIDINAYNYAKKLGLNNEGDFCVTVIKNDFKNNSKGDAQGDAKNEDSKYQVEAIQNLYIKNIINIVKNTTLRGIVFSRDEDIYIIFSGTRGNHKMRQYIDRIEDQILDLDPKIKITRGGIYNSLENIKRSFCEAEQCAKMITDYDISLRKIDYDGIGIWQLLVKLDKKDLEEYATKVLKNLLTEKTEKNREFLLTLVTYVINNQNIKETAQKLNMHYNSIYFRIKKIEEILNLDFDNKEDWLNINLACSIFSKCDNFH